MSITPGEAPVRPAYVQDGSTGLYYRIGGGSTSDAWGRWEGSQDAYDALGSYDDTVLYVILPAPPSAPTDLSATPDKTTILLNWVNPNGELLDIVVRRAAGSTAPATIDAGTDVAVLGIIETITDTGLTAGNTYSYSVFASNYAGYSLAASITVTTLPPETPNPPTGFTATPSTTSVTLTWAHPLVGGYTGYIVRRAAGPVAPATISSGTGVTVTGTPTTVSDTGLTEGTQYSYSIWTVNTGPLYSIAVTVTTTTTTSIGTILWEDTFDRANVVGLTGVGNGWHADGTAHTANITSNQLERVGSSYGRTANPATGALPANLEIEISFNAVARTGGNFGLFARLDTATHTGVRIFCVGTLSTITVGDTTDFNAGNIGLSTINAIPASWLDTEGTHTMGAKLNGATIDVYLDGVNTHRGTMTTNQAITNGQVGFCGAGSNRMWDRFTVRGL